MHRIAALLVIGTLACGDTTVPDVEAATKPPSWVGTFAYLADSARKCTAGGLPNYPCTCDPPGWYEGTVTLVQKDGLPSGTMQVRACYPDGGCGPEESLAVVASAAGAEPPLRFCGKGCYNGYANDSTWSHQVELQTDNTISGSYVRADGTVRGCGMDLGPFELRRLE